MALVSSAKIFLETLRSWLGCDKTVLENLLGQALTLFMLSFAVLRVTFVGGDRLLRVLVTKRYDTDYICFLPSLL